MGFATVKLVHVTAVVVSWLLFFVRGVYVLADSGWMMSCPAGAKHPISRAGAGTWLQ